MIAKVINASNVARNKTNIDNTDTIPMLSFILFLLIFNIALHSVGCVLLYSTLRKGKGMIQQLFVLHLSISELLKNMLKVYRYTVRLLHHFHVLPPIVDQIRIVVKLCHRWGTYPLYFLIMVYLTIDRLLVTLFTVRYRLYFDERKARCVLAGIWLFIAVLVAVLPAGQLTGTIAMDKLLPTYIYVSLHVFYLLLAIITYSLMAHKFSQSKRPGSAAEKKDEEPLPSSYTTPQAARSLKEPHLFIFFMIVTSFLLVSVIPGFLYIVVILNNVHMKYPNAKLAVHLCFILSDTIDALIYIFLQKSIRKLFMRKLALGLKCCFRSQSLLAEPSSQERTTTAWTPTGGTNREVLELIQPIEEEDEEGGTVDT